MSHTVTIIFGDAAVRAFNNGERSRAELQNLGDIVERTFSSKIEANAYLMGIDDADGWLDSMVLEDAVLTEDELER